MRTIKKIKIPRTNITALRASLGSHIRINKNSSLAFSFSFVLDEALQLKETPMIEPSVQSLAHKLIPALSYSFKVLQNDRVSRSNNIFADFVVNPTHITFLPATQSFKPSYSRLCAFTLESFPQVLELHNLGLMTIKDLAIRTDGKVVYSEVNTNYFLVATRNRGIDISRECDMKEHLSFSIFDNLKSLVIPVQVFPIIFRNRDWNILPFAFGKGSNPNLFKRESEKVSVETNRTGFHNWLDFKLGSFKIFRSLCYGFTGKVSRKPLPQILVNKMVKLKSVAYLGFKSFINGILDSLKKSAGHINKLLIIINFQLYSSDRFHSNKIKVLLYKLYAGRCPVLMEVSLASPPQ